MTSPLPEGDALSSPPRLRRSATLHDNPPEGGALPAAPKPLGEGGSSSTRLRARAATPLLITLAFLPLAVLLPSLSPAQSQVYEEAPFFYSETEPRDPIAALRRRLESGRLKLEARDEKEFLRSFLEELEVPVESQVLVFSKTSKQNDRITPQTPRAVYFSEEFYVGWVPGGVMEIGSIDPQLGAVFYLVDHRARATSGLRFERPQDCLSCHAGSRTGDLPGFLVRSVYPDARGYPLLSAGSFVTDHGSPLHERWGGWYVTGQHGSQLHMGNVIATEEDGEVFLDREAGANVLELEDLFSTKPYLVPRSDILALMVLEHQVEMHNRLNRAAFSLERTLHLQEQIDEALGRSKTRKLSGSALSVANSHAEKILEHLLFQKEIPLPDGGIDDIGNFRDAFRVNRRESKEGRSLKDFQLLDRIFKYRCSYMIYSRAFDHLPGPLKQIVYRRLWDILNGRDPSPDFDYLGESERTRILSILIDTKPNLPGYWKL